MSENTMETTSSFRDALQTSTANASSFDGLVTGDVVNIVTIINFAIICAVLFVFGSIANIINIIVFAKIGFKDSTNLSLLVLSISDFGCCISLLLFVLCFNPYFKELDFLPFDPNDFHYLSGWVHIIFSRITSFTTAFLTFERCLCVAAPMTVKEIITTKRVIVFLACTVVLVVACISIHFGTATHVWKLDPARNKSILVLVFYENSERLDSIAFTVHSIVLPVITFLVVLISTIVLVVNLKAKNKWRENATTTAKSASTSLSSRDAKVSRMVVTIATLFIICFIPIMFSFVSWLALPGFHIQGRYRNLFVIMFSLHFTLDSTNSSLNIFIYHRMSTNYRTVFRQLFGGREGKKLT